MGHYLNKLNRLFMLLATWLISIETFAINTSTNEESLEYKIANKLQLTDVPTIYIDIDGITDETSLGNIL